MELKEVIILSWSHMAGPASCTLLGVFSTEQKSDVALKEFKKIYPHAPGFAVSRTVKLDEFSMNFPEC